MSFLTAVDREIRARPVTDPIGITLRYLFDHGIGHARSVPLDTIVAHLNAQGVSMTNTRFQQTILAESRQADFFIGSGRRGYFLIETREDAEHAAQFYDSRIRAETQNVSNLRRQASAVGWTV